MKNFFNGFVPRYFGNGAVLWFYELLRKSQRILGKKDWQHLDINAEKLISHLKHAEGFGGFIEDQNNYADILLGKVSMKFAGCEIFAVYNTLKALENKIPEGKRLLEQYPLYRLIEYFEADGLVLSGSFGTAPKALCDFFIKHGFNAILTTKENEFEKLAEDAAALILTMYNDRDDITKEVHTVCITKSDEGFIAHNVYCNGKIVGPAKNLMELIGSFNGGKAKGISLIGIQGWK